MSDNDPSAADPIGQIADEFVEAVRLGKRPSLEEFARRYPAHADEIRELLPALTLIEEPRPADENVERPRNATAAAPLKQLGDYRILREVGRGGMGIVYEAQQLSLGRHVAIKVLPAQALLEPRQLGRFQREARSAARLHHTNIVPVFGVGEQAGLHYYVMQFISGLALDKVLDELRRLRFPRSQPAPTCSGSDGIQGDEASEVSATFVAQGLLSGKFYSPGSAATLTGPIDAAAPAATGTGSVRADDTSANIHLPGQTHASTLSDSGSEYWRSAARVGVQVADALAHAAGHGVLHRDIKPANLLLDENGNVWVTDFGLAKADNDGDNLTNTGDLVGTLRYLAPERFNGQGDVRSDVYSLGLTLYELLTLQHAFGAADRNKLIKQVMHDEPVRPRKLNPRVPRDLETVVLKAIARDPARRYQSAKEMQDDLERFLQDRPVRARRVSEVEKFWLWCRRNPGIALLGSALAALLAAATIASLLAAGHFNRAALRERDARQEADRRGDAERWERYRSNIAVAAGALQLQNGSAARSALEATPEEHRNWEWRYLHNQLDGASQVLNSPGGAIKSLALSSPSDRQVAFCCLDHDRVYLCDVATGRPGPVLEGHTAPVTSVAYRPDGKQIATSGNDQTIRLWDPQTGRQTALLQVNGFPGKLERLPQLAYNADGSRIGSYATADGGTGTCRLWDSTTGREIAILASWQGFGPPLVFSPDGKRVLVGSNNHAFLCDAATGRRVFDLGTYATDVAGLIYSPDGRRVAVQPGNRASTLHIFDAENGKKVAALPEHSSGIGWAQFSPDGSRLVSTNRYPDNVARLWDVATGRRLAVLSGHKNDILGVAFSPDGRRLVTASSDQTARLWNGQTGQYLATLAGHAHLINHVLFSPDGSRIVTGSSDATMRLWDSQTGDLIGLLRGHEEGFQTFCPPKFTPDGSLLISGSTDGTVRIWDMGLVERNGILKGHTKYVYDVAFNSDNERVASSAWDGTARLWNATTGQQIAALKHKTDIIASLAFRQDGRRLVTGEVDVGVTLWDLDARKAVLRVPDGPWGKGHLARATLNLDGTLLATIGGDDGLVGIWDAATGREVARLPGSDKPSLDLALKFHPDGSLLAATGENGTVRLWDVDTHALVAVLGGHTDLVSGAGFSADGRLLATGSLDKTIRIWNVQTHELVESIPLGSIVFSVAFGPDGKRLAAGCRDSTIRLVDIVRGQQVAELRGHTDYVHAVAWSPDGTRLVSGSGDFTVRIWDALSVQERAKRAAKAASTGPPRS